MFAPLRLALLISLISIVIYLAYPIMMFINDFTSNPECITIIIDNYEMINETHSKAIINLYYCSSVELSNVNVVIGDNVVFFERVTTGDNRKSAIIKIDDLDLELIELTIARIFRVKLLFE